MKNYKIVILLLVVIFTQDITISAKTKKSDESRFQMGFGVMVSTSNLLSIIENVKLYNAMENGEEYKFPGLSEDVSIKFSEVSKNLGRALLVSNIIGAMEFGINSRILYKAFMLDSNLILLPFDGSYNGRLDFLVSVNMGLRAPFWIMPYINAGVNFTFSWYPQNVTDIDSWKNWGVFNNFVFRPGLNLRAGLDIKFRHFSVGAYYQYTIKDFEEFGGWFSKIYGDLSSQNYENAQAQAFGLIFASQSRFGAVLSWYLF